MIEKIKEFERNGKINEVYRITNKNGCELDILTYGARIIRLTAPDKDGNMGDVIVGYEKAEDYIDKSRAYYGALIGRYGNRIGGSKFTLNGKTYSLQANNGKNSLHGGFDGFDVRTFDAEVKGEKLVLSYTSPDGEGGYPGTLKVECTYQYTDDNEVVIDYFATCDKDTVCNLTNHAYFNIGNDDTVLEQELMINASRITPVDDELIPHNDFMDIAGTPYSFKNGELLKTNMFSSDHMIANCKGFDFNYCLDCKGEKDIEHFAYVLDKASGRKMDCYTDQPGVQLYTSNTMKGTVGKKVYENYCALCLETQGYPNSPNCPAYPSTVLKAGEPYRTTTIYKFSVQK